MVDERPSLTALRSGTPFVSYAYSYPHKLAYSTLSPAVPLADAWQNEKKNSLFLYAHIPFCEYRCGFCNLFTQSQPAIDLPRRYLDQLRVEAIRVREALGECQFARLAIGGGTPTFLSLNELQSLWRIFNDVMDAHSQQLPTSIEASPATIDCEKLQFLRYQGVERLSLGVQSFDDETSGHLGRPQRRSETERALELLRETPFPVLNLDLIYGAESQSLSAWLETVRTAISYSPTEIYLYPLYVREQTGLGRRERDWDDVRLDAYRAARDELRGAGYVQVSFRMFARSTAAINFHGPVYCCQSDGMVGLGCGARSYTSRLHYSSDYAVSQSGVRAILGDYLSRSPESFSCAHHGIWLDDDEQRRRYLMLSILQKSGLKIVDYEVRFGTSPWLDFDELDELQQAGLAAVRDGSITLTEEGIELSDAIGPWLASSQVRHLVEERTACLI